MKKIEKKNGVYAVGEEVTMPPEHWDTRWKKLLVARLPMIQKNFTEQKAELDKRFAEFTSDYVEHGGRCDAVTFAASFSYQFKTNENKIQETFLKFAAASIFYRLAMQVKEKPDREYNSYELVSSYNMTTELEKYLQLGEYKGPVLVNPKTGPEYSACIIALARAM